MTNEAEQFPSPNRLIHEPARLAILTVLSACKAADFTFLQQVTGLTKGNLSVQLTNLEQAGVVVITKEFVDKKPRTSVQLSPRGRTEVEEYWKTMDEIRSRMSGQENAGQPGTKSILKLLAGLAAEPIG